MAEFSKYLKKSKGSLSDKLGVLMSDIFMVYLKAWGFHWNIEGNAFDPFHKFFGEIYTKQVDVIDDIAERIRAIGEKAPSSMKEILELATGEETPSSEKMSQMEMVETLLEDFEKIVKLENEIQEISLSKYNDAATNDLIVGIQRDHEKLVWMLKSFGSEK